MFHGTREEVHGATNAGGDLQILHDNASLQHICVRMASVLTQYFSLEPSSWLERRERVSVRLAAQTASRPNSISTTQLGKYAKVRHFGATASDGAGAPLLHVDR